MQVVKRMASTTKMLTLKIFIPSRRREHDGATWMKVFIAIKPKKWWFSRGDLFQNAIIHSSGLVYLFKQ